MNWICAEEGTSYNARYAAEDQRETAADRALFARFETPLYLLSFNTYARRQILATAAVHAAFIKYCHRATEFGIIVGRYVIMPDHVHLLVCFGSGCTITLSEWIKRMKRQLSWALSDSSVWPTRIPGQILSSLWQPGFHDHVLRSSESYVDKWNYVHENPVRFGLVEIAEAWPYAGEIATID